MRIFKLFIGKPYQVSFFARVALFGLSPIYESKGFSWAAVFEKKLS